MRKLVVVLGNQTVDHASQSVSLAVILLCVGAFLIVVVVITGLVLEVVCRTSSEVVQTSLDDLLHSSGKGLEQLCLVETCLNLCLNFNLCLNKSRILRLSYIKGNNTYFALRILLVVLCISCGLASLDRC